MKPINHNHRSNLIQTPWQPILDRLSSFRIDTDVILAPFTTFGIGGPADLLFRAKSASELIEVVLAAKELEIPYFVMGKGANLLIGDRGFRGLVIVCEIGGIDYLDDNHVRAGSGVTTYPHLISTTAQKGLGGLHHFVGIPSTVGGAMWQNLHFLSPEPDRTRTIFIEEFVDSACIFSEENEIQVVDKDYFKFSYDYSILHERKDIVLSVDFSLEQADPIELHKTMEENLEWRKERHPDLQEFGSVGSIFKKIESIGAGRLIDTCGLKGKTFGDAQIFDRHANIIINLGAATASDVLRLIDLAQSSVAKEHGYELVPEITFVGEF